MTIHPETLRRIHEWLLGDDTGLSSRFLCGIILDIEVEVNRPHDADDFGRCYRLLSLLTMQQAREVLIIAAKISPAWAIIRENWSELVEAFRHDERKHAEAYPLWGSGYVFYEKLRSMKL